MNNLGNKQSSLPLKEIHIYQIHIYQIVCFTMIS